MLTENSHHFYEKWLLRASLSSGKHGNILLHLILTIKAKIWRMLVQTKDMEETWSQQITGSKARLLNSLVDRAEKMTEVHGELSFLAFWNSSIKYLHPSAIPKKTQRAGVQICTQFKSPLYVWAIAGQSKRTKLAK